jgi:hypothetical protein
MNLGFSTNGLGLTCLAKKAMHVSTSHLWEMIVHNLGAQKLCLTQVDSNVRDDVAERILVQFLVKKHMCEVCHFDVTMYFLS